jgi:hypothetical protein
MKIEQYEQLKSQLKDQQIFGQWVTAITITEPSDLKKEYKDSGIMKISMFQGHISKKSYLEMVNDRTAQAGIEVKAVRESHYNDEGLSGFFKNLKSDESKKYILFMFAPESHKKPTYVYSDGKREYSKDEVCKPKSESAREAALADLNADVKYRPFKIESVAYLTIAGQKVIDTERAEMIADYVKGLYITESGE